MTAGKKFFKSNKGLSLVLGTVGVLGVLCAFSILFVDQRLFEWQRGQYERYSEPLLLRAFVLLGKGWLPAWLLLCWGVLWRQRTRALIGLIALLFVLSVLPIKLTTQRLRPRNVMHNDIPVTAMEKFKHSWSFPSGDTASAFAVATAAAPFVGWGFRIVFFTAAGVIGFFRVVMYAHYCGDAIGGAILGIVCGYLAMRFVISRPATRRWLLKVLSREVMIAAIILIPVIHGASGNWDQIRVFAMFYPAIVGAMFLVGRIQTAKG